MNKYKKVPKYWWDFEDPYWIIVESDHKKFPIVAKFKYNPNDGLGCAEKAIEQAGEYINKLEWGQITPRPISL